MKHHYYVHVFSISGHIPGCQSMGTAGLTFLPSRTFVQLIIEHLNHTVIELYSEVGAHEKHKAKTTPSCEFLWLNLNLLSVLTGTILVWVAHKLILYTKAEYS